MGRPRKSTLKSLEHIKTRLQADVRVITRQRLDELCDQLGYKLVEALEAAVGQFHADQLPDSKFVDRK